MDLIDRYLNAVRGYLPGRNRDDIVSEIGDDLRARSADREEELGRPLTLDDQAELLRPFGHPMTLAARYRPTQQLISPVLFPFYWLGLRISIGIAVTVQLALGIAMIASGQPGGAVIGRLASFPFTGLVTLFGWITLVFALVDVHVRHLAARATGAWDPRTLTEPPKELLEKTFWGTAFELAFSTVGLVWWLAIPRQPWLVFGPAAAFLAMAPAWQAVHLPLATLWLATLVVRWTLLLRPDWKGLRVGIDVATSVVGLVVTVFLLRADAIVMQAPGFDAGAKAVEIARLVEAINVAARIAVLVWLCSFVWELAKTLWAYARR